VGGYTVNKSEQLLKGFREIYNKIGWLNKTKMQASLGEYKSSEVHCIEFIGSNADSNVTRLAESLYMTRGAATKITQKLIQKSVIESYQKQDNKKEIYFRLTEQGQAVYKIHEGLHAEFTARDRTVFEQVTDEQFDIMLDFVDTYCRHLDTEIQKKERLTD
jgi:DNA-binding MarR family transcriptional regulator